MVKNKLMIIPVTCMQLVSQGLFLKIHTKYKIPFKEIQNEIILVFELHRLVFKSCTKELYFIKWESKNLSQNLFLVTMDIQNVGTHSVL